MDTNIVIRKADKDDFGGIFALIKKMAEFENKSSEVKLTKEQFIADGLSSNPTFDCFVAEQTQGGSNHLVGYAMFYNIYSSFDGKSMFLEDIYVTEDYRAKGVGSRLYKQVAKEAIDRGCSQLDYVVLNWNDKAIKFHQKMGATDLTQSDNYHLFRNKRPALCQLIEDSTSGIS